MYSHFLPLSTVVTPMDGCPRLALVSHLPSSGWYISTDGRGVCCWFMPPSTITWPPSATAEAPCPRSGQRGQLAPRLTLYIQDFHAVQGGAGLAAAPQHIEKAFVVDGSAVDAALRHGGELLPVQRLDRTHRHLLHRHVSRKERRGHTITRRTRDRRCGGGTR
ncbi:hypothetical protein CgunFtcFv8_000189 [Champsocephalus gunnari]|uniref:Uncharacterized protein n=1 Tax=Champsocephalus gunnari TaxID=52237 RepID=A0AAN8HPT5_CHAGU|nr:hypothetical protein CgunFtcFv8_000189 [Champsocephalus gunnari]